MVEKSAEEMRRAQREFEKRDDELRDQLQAAVHHALQVPVGAPQSPGLIRTVLRDERLFVHEFTRFISEQLWNIQFG